MPGLAACLGWRLKQIHIIAPPTQIIITIHHQRNIAIAIT